MSIRKIVTIENPVLRQKAKKVRTFNASIPKLIDDMFETMHAANGAGLAAPQIDLSLRVFVAEYEERRIVMVNPEIAKAEGEVLGAEGCLSIPGYYGDNIRRAERIVVRGQDAHGKNIRIKAEGWLARILQHEIDHLDGVLFLDRLDRPEDLHEVSSEEEEGELEREAVIE